MQARIIQPLDKPGHWRKYADMIKECNKGVKLIHCHDSKSNKYLRDFETQLRRDKKLNWQESSALDDTSLKEYGCVIFLVSTEGPEAGKVASAVSMLVLEDDHGKRWGQVSSNTASWALKRGYNKVLRILAYHSMVNYFGCEYLISMALDASKYILSTTFKWNLVPPGERLHIHRQNCGPINYNYIGDYTAKTTPEYRELDDLFHKICDKMKRLREGDKRNQDEFGDRPHSKRQRRS